MHILTFCTFSSVIVELEVTQNCTNGMFAFTFPSVSPSCLSMLHSSYDPQLLPKISLLHTCWWDLLGHNLAKRTTGPGF